MPEYSQIQTYVKCNEESFSSIIADFISVLTEIGFDNNFLLDSFRDLEWEVCDNGFVYVGTNVESVKINLFGTELNINPHVMGWTSEAFKQIHEPRLEISLLFETEEIALDCYPFQIQDSVKMPLLEAMDLILQRFNETGVYLTDEVTDGKPWEALMGCNDDLWSFDAAIIPLSISVYHDKLPSRFIKKVEDNKIYYANGTTWGKEL